MEISVGIYAVIFIFFFLIIPGFLARRFYFNGEFSKQLNTGANSLLNLIYSLFIGILLSLIFVTVFNLISDNRINIDDVLNKFDDNFVTQNISNNEDIKELIPTSGRFDGLTENMYQKYLPFIGVMYILSSLLGLVLSKLVVFFGLDTKWKFLRFSNTWYYLFSGKILKFKQHSSNSSLDHKLKVKYTYLDILVTEKGEETTLYSGFFADYDICPYDISKLEKVYLLKATRYKKTENGVIVKNIPGNLFTIMGDRILNINCTYICFEEEERRASDFLIHTRILIPAQILTTIFFITILVSLLFSLNIFNSNLFGIILSKSFLTKVTLIFLLNVTIGLLTPFVIDRENTKVKFIGISPYLYKIIVILILWLVLIFLNINDDFFRFGYKLPFI